MTQSHDSHTEEITARIARLEAAVEALTLKVEKQIKHNDGMHRLADRMHNRIDNSLADAFERIKNMELRLSPNLVPNLVSDILRLHEIVPPDGKAWNPLDYRDP
jgi:hypothetical protein